jgi:predicted outer membrane repeat protein
MKKLTGLMFTLAAASLAHEASAADLNVCQLGCVFPTIQSAVNSSHAGDVIHVAAGTYFENLEVPNQRLTILGAGQDQTVIDGRQLGTVVTLGNLFDPSPAQTVQIIGVTITHGSAQNGGGIWVQGVALDLQNSIVSSNFAGGSGGGILLEAFAVPAKITGSMIVHNRARTGGGIMLIAECVAQISNSTIARNTATLQGGGLFADGAAQSTIDTSTFSDNTAQQDSGGGIYLNTGEPKATMTLATTSVVGNHSAGFGGGILAAGNLQLGASVVTGNNVPDDIFR